MFKIGDIVQFKHESKIVVNRNNFGEPIGNNSTEHMKVFSVRDNGMIGVNYGWKFSFIHYSQLKIVN